MTHTVRAALAAFVLITAGCGDSPPTGVKEKLDDKEKQQIKDLNDQRKQEWGGTKEKR